MDTSITHIRPRFRLEVARPSEEVMSRVRMGLDKPPPSIKGYVQQDVVTLDIVSEEVHFWSPYMTFRVEEDEEKPGQTIVAGLIGPRPVVWTLFTFFYFSVGTTGFIITSFGVSRWMLGEYTYSLLGFPLAILFMLTAYRAGKYGETLGADQVEILKQFIRDNVLNGNQPAKPQDESPAPG